LCLVTPEGRARTHYQDKLLLSEPGTYAPNSDNSNLHTEEVKETTDNKKQWE